MTRLRIALSVLLIGWSVCSAVHRVCALEVAWTMVVVPDTQNYRTGNGQLPKLYTMMQWIVDSKESRNIELVVSQGDFTGNFPNQWADQAGAWGTLNGELPYIVVTGNHDYDPFSSVSDTDYDAILINDYFALSDNPLNSITTERITGKIENSFSTFVASDGRKMLVFSLEWVPRTEVLDWANTIAIQPQYVDHTAVLLTHASYREGNVNPDGSHRSYRSPLGVPIWDALVGQHENFELVLNAHFLDGNDPDPFGPLTTGHQASVGIAGNTVHEIVFNAQEQANGGNGYMRLMEFMDDGKTVQVRTYSPTLDVWLTNDQNEFQIELTPLFSADFDFNGSVDDVDLAIWEASFGVNVSGDADHDGDSDGKDFLIWQRQIGGAPPLATSTAVPEPTTLVMALVVLTIIRGLSRTLLARRHRDEARHQTQSDWKK